MAHDKIDFHGEDLDKILDSSPTDKATLSELRTSVQELYHIFHEYLLDLQNKEVE